MEEKRKLQKQGKPVRTDYKSKVDEPQDKLQAEELKDQLGIVTPQEINVSAQDIQNERPGTRNRLSRSTRNVQPIRGKSPNENDKSIQRTKCDANEQLHLVKSWLDERKKPMHVKSFRLMNKSFGDMNTERNAIRSQSRNTGDLPSKLEEADIHAVLNENEEWGQCEKKLKEVRLWLDTTRRLLDPALNKKKTLREQLAVREKMLEDIVVQRSKISVSVEKLQVHFKFDVGGGTINVAEEAKELVVELDKIFDIVKEQSSVLKATVLQIDKDHQEILNYKQIAIEAEQKVRNIMRLAFKGTEKDKADELNTLKQNIAVNRKRILTLMQKIEAVDPYVKNSKKFKAILKFIDNKPIFVINDEGKNETEELLCNEDSKKSRQILLAELDIVESKKIDIVDQVDKLSYADIAAGRSVSNIVCNEGSSTLNKVPDEIKKIDAVENFQASETCNQFKSTSDIKEIERQNRPLKRRPKSAPKPIKRDLRISVVMNNNHMEMQSSLNVPKEDCKRSWSPTRMKGEALSYSAVVRGESFTKLSDACSSNHERSVSSLSTLPYKASSVSFLPREVSSVENVIGGYVSKKGPSTENALVEPSIEDSYHGTQIETAIRYETKYEQSVTNIDTCYPDIYPSNTNQQEKVSSLTVSEQMFNSGLDTRHSSILLNYADPPLTTIKALVDTSSIDCNEDSVAVLHPCPDKSIVKGSETCSKPENVDTDVDVKTFTMTIDEADTEKNNISTSYASVLSQRLTAGVTESKTDVSSAIKTSVTEICDNKVTVGVVGDKKQIYKTVKITDTVSINSYDCEQQCDVSDSLNTSDVCVNNNELSKTKKKKKKVKVKISNVAENLPPNIENQVLNCGASNKPVNESKEPGVKTKKTKHLKPMLTINFCENGKNQDEMKLESNGAGVINLIKDSEELITKKGTLDKNISNETKTMKSGLTKECKRPSAINENVNMSNSDMNTTEDKEIIKATEESRTKEAVVVGVDISKSKKRKNRKKQNGKTTCQDDKDKKIENGLSKTNLATEKEGQIGECLTNDSAKSYPLNTETPTGSECKMLKNSENTSQNEIKISDVKQQTLNSNIKKPKKKRNARTNRSNQVLSSNAEIAKKVDTIDNESGVGDFEMKNSKEKKSTNNSDETKPLYVLEYPSKSDVNEDANNIDVCVQQLSEQRHGFSKNNANLEVLVEANDKVLVDHTNNLQQSDISCRSKEKKKTKQQKNRKQNQDSPKTVCSVKVLDEVLENRQPGSEITLTNKLTVESNSSNTKIKSETKPNLLIEKTQEVNENPKKIVSELHDGNQSISVNKNVNDKLKEKETNKNQEADVTKLSNLQVKGKQVDNGKETGNNEANNTTISKKHVGEGEGILNLEVKAKSEIESNQNDESHKERETNKKEDTELFVSTTIQTDDQKEHEFVPLTKKFTNSKDEDILKLDVKSVCENEQVENNKIGIEVEVSEKGDMEMDSTTVEKQKEIKDTSNQMAEPKGHTSKEEDMILKLEVKPTFVNNENDIEVNSSHSFELTEKELDTLEDGMSNYDDKSKECQKCSTVDEVILKSELKPLLMNKQDTNNKSSKEIETLDKEDTAFIGSNTLILENDKDIVIDQSNSANSWHQTDPVKTIGNDQPVLDLSTVILQELVDLKFIKDKLSATNEPKEIITSKPTIDFKVNIVSDNLNVVEPIALQETGNIVVNEVKSESFNEQYKVDSAELKELHDEHSHHAALGQVKDKLDPTSYQFNIPMDFNISKFIPEEVSEEGNKIYEKKGKEPVKNPVIDDKIEADLKTSIIKGSTATKECKIREKKGKQRLKAPVKKPADNDKIEADLKAYETYCSTISKSISNKSILKCENITPDPVNNVCDDNVPCNNDDVASDDFSLTFSDSSFGGKLSESQERIMVFLESKDDLDENSEEAETRTTRLNDIIKEFSPMFETIRTQQITIVKETTPDKKGRRKPKVHSRHISLKEQAIEEKKKSSVKTESSVEMTARKNTVQENGNTFESTKEKKAKSKKGNDKIDTESCSGNDTINKIENKPKSILKRKVKPVKVTRKQNIPISEDKKTLVNTSVQTEDANVNKSNVGNETKVFTTNLQQEGIETTVIVNRQSDNNANLEQSVGFKEIMLENDSDITNEDTILCTALALDTILHTETPCISGEFDRFGENDSNVRDEHNTITLDTISHTETPIINPESIVSEVDKSIEIMLLNVSDTSNEDNTITLDTILHTEAPFINPNILSEVNKFKEMTLGINSDICSEDDNFMHDTTLNTGPPVINSSDISLTDVINQKGMNVDVNKNVSDSDVPEDFISAAIQFEILPTIESILKYAIDVDENDEINETIEQDKSTNLNKVSEFSKDESFLCFENKENCLVYELPRYNLVLLSNAEIRYAEFATEVKLKRIDINGQSYDNKMFYHTKNYDEEVTEEPSNIFASTSPDKLQRFVSYDTLRTLYTEEHMENPITTANETMKECESKIVSFLLKTDTTPCTASTEEFNKSIHKNVFTMQKPEKDSSKRLFSNDNIQQGFDNSNFTTEKHSEGRSNKSNTTYSDQIDENALNTLLANLAIDYFWINKRFCHDAEVEYFEKLARKTCRMSGGINEYNDGVGVSTGSVSSGKTLSNTKRLSSDFRNGVECGQGKSKWPSTLHKEANNTTEVVNSAAQFDDVEKYWIIVIKNKISLIWSKIFNFIVYMLLRKQRPSVNDKN